WFSGPWGQMAGGKRGPFDVRLIMRQKVPDFVFAEMLPYPRQVQDLGHHQEHGEAAIGVDGSEAIPGGSRFAAGAHPGIMNEVAANEKAMRLYLRFDGKLRTCRRFDRQGGSLPPQRAVREDRLFFRLAGPRHRSAIIELWALTPYPGSLP